MEKASFFLWETAVFLPHTTLTNRNQSEKRLNGREVDF